MMNSPTYRPNFYKTGASVSKGLKVGIREWDNRSFGAVLHFTQRARYVSGLRQMPSALRHTITLCAIRLRQVRKEKYGMMTKGQQCGRYSKSGRDKRKRMRRKDKAEKAPMANDPEKVLQSQVEEYLDALNIRYIHVPDLIGRLCRPIDNRLKIHEKAVLSYRFKGVLDLLIFGRRENGKYPECLVIELKAGSNQPTTDQRDWLNYLYGEDWPRWAVCKSFDQAKAAIDDFWRICCR